MEISKQDSTNLINTIILTVIIILLFIYGKTFIKNNAIDNCMKNSAVVVKNADNSSWQGPNKDWFEKCLIRKDFK